MNKELQNKIFADFPEMFNTTMNDIVTIYPIRYGIHCHDGWFDIIYHLCENLLVYCKNNNLKVVQVVQIKSKFGELRFYTLPIQSKIDINTEELNVLLEHRRNIYTIIHTGLLLSKETCEVCSNFAENIKIGNVYWTVCEECRDKFKEGWRPWIEEYNG